jgi:hypothetical protein
MQPPFWNLISVGLPVAGVIAGALAGSSMAGRGGTMADGIGQVFAGLMVAGVFCIFGEAAAIKSLWRGERLSGLALLGALVNGIGAVAGLYLLIRSDVLRD